MADSTDIDALVVQARATARELNELLEKLEASGVEVSVIWPQRIEGMTPVLSRVDLTLRFRPELRNYNATTAGLAGSAIQQQGTPLGLSPREAMEHARKIGILR